MDEPESKNNSSESSEESEEAKDRDKKWGFSLISENSFWCKKILNIYTYQNSICREYHRNTLSLNEPKKIEFIKSNIYALLIKKI